MRGVGGGGYLAAEDVRQALEYAALRAEEREVTLPAAGMPTTPFGFRPFPKRGGIVTNALIDKLRESGDY